MYNLKHVIFLGWFLLFTWTAQGQGKFQPEEGDEGKTQVTQQEMLPGTEPETNPADSLGNGNAVSAPKGDIQTTIKYTSADSMFLDAINQMMYLYGNARVDYGTTSLQADKIVIDYTNNTLQANGRVDSLGKPIGYPVFAQDGQEFQTENITYDFKKDRALIKGVVTQEGEAYMHGDDVVKNDKNELFIRDAKYTTCNLKEPHFHIQSKKLKMIKDDKLITGPFNLYINDVPTPLGFAFGMFPAPRERVSGIIMPEFGEEKRRGFFLQDMGYYWKMSDYITAEFMGSIYSKGSYGLSSKFDYKKRYSYSGSFSLRYNFNAPETEISQSSNKAFWVNWNHTPQTRGTGRFSANVSAGTSSYNTYNATTYRDMTNSNFNSSVSYSKSFQGTPFSLAASLRHTQNITDETMSLTLPELSFTMNRIYPFRKKGSTGKKWYENIGLDYRMNAKNTVSNKARNPGFNFDIANYDSTTYEQVPFDLDNLGVLYDRMENGVSHKTNINTSLKLFKHFTLTPSLSYEEIWYGKELNYDYIESQNAVRVDTLNTFSRTGSWSTSASLNTRVYGNFYISKNGPVKAIRHVLIPSVSYAYRPDLSENGMYNVQVNEDGDTELLSKYDGFIFGSPTGRESSVLSLGISNNLEMKVRDRSDTTGSGYKKVSLLDNLSIRSSYDMLRDSFNLSNISITANTSLLNNKVRVNMNATVDPYSYVLIGKSIDEKTGDEIVDQERSKEFAWDNGQGLGSLKAFSMSLSTSLNPKTFSSTSDKGKNKDNKKEEEFSELYNDPDMYVRWDIPWNVSLNYRMNYRNEGAFSKGEFTHSLNFNGDVNVTPKWKIGFNSGYDFKNKDFTHTQLNIYRDLHCWDMRVNWVPFGAYQSFSLNIAVKASVLQDLKLSRRRNWRDN